MSWVSGYGRTLIPGRTIARGQCPHLPWTAAHVSCTNKGADSDASYHLLALARMCLTVAVQLSDPAAFGAAVTRIDV